MRRPKTQKYAGITSNFLEANSPSEINFNYKVAIVKTNSNPFGSWRRLDDANLSLALDYWPGKLSYWPLTEALNAHWFLIDDPIIETDFYKEIEKSWRGLNASNNAKGVVHQSEIDFEKYDIIISTDPILRIPTKTSALFCYYVNEHTDRYYLTSADKPFLMYDLFLDHMLMLNFPSKHRLLGRLPSSVPCPYVYRPLQDNHDKDGSISIDFRAAELLSQNNIVAKLPYPSKTKPLFAPSEKPTFTDALEYLASLKKSNYFVTLGRNSGSGQAICEAAEVDCICISDRNTPYSYIMTHPACVCEDADRLPLLFAELKGREDEILEWQRRQLKRYFYDLPLFLLETALKAKQNRTYG